MADHILTVTASTDLTAGQAVQASNWAAGFDHAALVAALRSRSDAKDFRLRHQATGASVALNITGANTTACKVMFLLAAAISAPGSDTYILTTGDLRNSASPFSTITGAGVGAASLAVTAAALPVPGLPFGRHDVFDVINSDGSSSRRGLASENGRAKYRLRYAAVSPEDWYELRAIWNSSRGAATKLAVPAWIASSASGVTLTSATFSKPSAGHFVAELIAEEVIA